MKEIKYINKYQQLMDEIETYKQVIQEAYCTLSWFHGENIIKWKQWEDGLSDEFEI